MCNGYCSPYNPLYQNPMAEIPGNSFMDYAPTGIMVYTSNIMPEFTGKLLVVGDGGGQIYHGLIKADLGNPPYYDTIVNKTLVNDWNGYTTLMQGNDGYIYAMCFIYNGLNRLRPDLTSINNEGIPSGFSLDQNYPNPFNPETNIRYQILKNSFVSLKIYDLLGRELSSLVNENQVPGNYSVDWDGTNYPSGVYFYRLTTNDFTAEKKMVLVK